MMLALAVFLSLFAFSLGTHRQAPAIGSPAPNFSLDAAIDGQFKKISLADYKGKWLILLFYPLDFTFVCPTELTSFSDRMKDFRDINTEIVAASVDSIYSHLAWTNLPRSQGGLGRIEIPLISDFKKSLSYAYGVMYKDTHHTLRAIYLIDPNGIVRHISMTDLPVGRSVDEVFRIVTAFQHADANGVLCPAGWKKGSKAIDPQSAKDFFSSPK